MKGESVGRIGGGVEIGVARTPKVQVVRDRDDHAVRGEVAFVVPELLEQRCSTEQGS